MTDRDLIRRAEAVGVFATYLNSQGQRVQVSPETLAAILAVLDDANNGRDHIARPSPAAPGVAAPRSRPARLASTPRPRVPQDRSWGLTVQLYSVRSRRSWGHGDLRDLADLARWSASDLGAGFMLINPLHAAEPVPPISNSPYLPMTRRYLSPLYMRIEDIQEFDGLTAAQRQRIDDLSEPLRAASVTPELIDRDRVWAAKRTALELIHEVKRTSTREAEYRRYTAGQGAELAAWSTWCAIAELYGADWRRWPAALADPGRAASVIADGALASGGSLAARADFHAWLQWLLDQQLTAAQQAAREAGMPIGIIGDLAVGVHPGGSDAWAHQDLLVAGMSVGAPPDAFNQRGQDWAQPPWNPLRLAEAGGRPLAELFHAACRHAGGLRVDHVMGLMRLWWIPAGMPPDRGAYVSYDHKMMVGALTAETARAGALAIGEDLGTVDPWIRKYLASQHVLGTQMAWFTCEPDGSPLRPERWRRACMATVGTHDVPPVSAFLTGEQVTARARLGLLTDPAGERKAAELTLSGWRIALAAERLLPMDADATADAFTVAMYGYLALTPSLLIGVSLADAVGDRGIQNIPGTSDEHPNWRLPLRGPDGAVVLLEDLSELELVQAVADALGRPAKEG